MPAPWKVVFTVFLMGVSFSAPAPAEPAILLGNGEGLSLRLLRPSIDSKGLLTLNGSDVLGHLEPSFGLMLDAGLGIFPTAEGHRLMRGIYSGTFSANLGLGNIAAVGLALPVIVGEGRASSQVVGFSQGASGRTIIDEQAVGHVVLQGKVRLLRISQGRFGLAATLQLGLPTGPTRSVLDEPGGFAWPGIAFDAEPIAWLRLSANLGARWVFGSPSTVGQGGSRVAYESPLTFGLGGALVLSRGVLELAAETYGLVLPEAAFAPAATPVEGLVGLRIFVDGRSHLLLGAGGGLSSGFSSADARLLLGFVLEPSIGDRDGDGLRDDVDRCPSNPEDHDDFADEDGCPDPDNDRDQILDPDDECPLIPEDRDGDEDRDGCPDGGSMDRDGDRILDDVDGCPDEPEDHDQFEESDGCPDPDNDRDLRLDPDDLCPNEPEDVDQFDDADGCPDPDNDDDRILDVDDDCPNDREEYNGLDDDDGCPDHGVVGWGDGELIAMEPVYFRTDSAVILERSFRLLDAIAAALNGNLQVRLLEIQGHADERGDDEYNLRLTRERAAAVLAALVERGVERSRLRSAGYGERCPKNPRHGARAWAQNRRVDFKVVETRTGRTANELICPAGRALSPDHGVPAER